MRFYLEQHKSSIEQTLGVSINPLSSYAGGSYFQPLSWSHRLKVAVGAAKGLAFLHSAEAKVIYRDFKTANILLDSVFIFFTQILIIFALSFSVMS